MDETDTNPIKARTYYLYCAMNMKRLALQHRTQILDRAHHCSVVGFQDVFSDDLVLAHWAKTEEAVANTIFEHFDSMIRSGIQPAHCTCRVNK